MILYDGMEISMAESFVILFLWAIDIAEFGGYSPWSCIVEL